MGHLTEYPDPDNFLCSSEWGSAGWQDEAFINLVEGVRQVADQDERMRTYQQADNILVEETPILPLIYWRFLILVKL